VMTYKGHEEEKKKWKPWFNIVGSRNDEMRKGKARKGKADSGRKKKTVFCTAERGRGKDPSQRERQRKN